MKKRGPKEIDKKIEILEYLQENGVTTVPQLCEALNVCAEVIRRDIKGLQVEGKVLIPTRHGYKYLKNGINNEDDANDVIVSVKWSKGFLDMGLRVGVMSGGHLIESIRELSESLSDSEIKKLKHIYSVFSMSMQMIETQRDFDESKLLF